MKIKLVALSALIIAILVSTVFGYLYWTGNFSSQVTVTGLDVLATSTTPQDYAVKTPINVLTSDYKIALSITKYYGVPQLFLSVNVTGTQSGQPVTGFNWTCVGQYVLFWHHVQLPYQSWDMTPIGSPFQIGATNTPLTINSMLWSFYEGDTQPTGSNALLLTFAFSATKDATHCEPDTVINLNVNLQIKS